MAAPIDLTGKRFGRLLVLAQNPEPYVSPRGIKTTRWDCICDCGNRVTVLRNQLTGGSSTSCGCFRKERVRAATMKNDLAGKVFGRLTVIEPRQLPAQEANGNTMGWRCRCACGKEIILPRRYLVQNGTLSCGCLLSDTAREKGADPEINKRFDGTMITHIAPKEKLNSNNASGVRGVYWNAREKRWIAKIGLRNKEITLGRFYTREAAAEARAAAEERYYQPILKAYEADQIKGGHTMNDKIFYTLAAETANYTDRDAYISDLALSSIWAEGADIATAARICGAVWDVTHLSIRDIRTSAGLTQAEFSTRFLIPKRTVENWEGGASACPIYTRLMLAKLCGLFPAELDH